jgi:hypothetical protein
VIKFKPIFLCLLLTHCLKGMETTFQHQPTSFPQPRFARHNLGSFEFKVAQDTAKNSFDRQGNVVSLLNFNGSTNLLKRFVDSTLAYNNTDTFGKAIMSGKLSTFQYNFTLTQNFGSHFFAYCSITTSQDRLKDLLIQPVINNCVLVSKADIDANQALQTYLKNLTNLLTDNNCDKGIVQNNIGPTVFTFGYTTSLQHFRRLDFMDITAQTGICLPLMPLDCKRPTLSAIPFTHNVNLGIPIMLTCAFGLYDWLNLGTTGLVTFYIKNDQIVPLNTTATNNTVLIAEQGLAEVAHKPFIYFNAYIEAEQLIPRVTCMFAISYEKQFCTTYKSSNPTKFPNALINQYPTHRPWQLLNLTFSGEIDLAKDSSKIMPRIKCMYVLPVWGRSVFKTSELMGQFALECAYSF